MTCLNTKGRVTRPKITTDWQKSRSRVTTLPVHKIMRVRSLGVRSAAVTSFPRVSFAALAGIDRRFNKQKQKQGEVLSLLTMLMSRHARDCNSA